MAPPRSCLLAALLVLCACTAGAAAASATAATTAAASSPSSTGSFDLQQAKAAKRGTGARHRRELSERMVQSKRTRRKLGVIELCSYSDTPSVLDAMEALSCTRLRCIACLRGSDAQTAMECTLAGDIADMNDRAPQDVQKGGAA